MQELDRDVFEELVRLRREGTPAALATLIESRGSTPQKPGAKMLISEQGPVVGTLGGGCLEAEVVAAAREAIREGAARTLSFNLTESAGGLVCGGTLLVFIEPLAPPARLVILGAGHVGKALARAARFGGFHVTVVDDRAEFADPGRLPDAHVVAASSFGEAFATVPADRETFVVVVTRGHKQDFTAVRAALATPARYVGLVGSRTKRALLLTHLTQEGFGAADRERLVTPAGLPIGSVTPEEIALSIVAQLIGIRRGHGADGGGAGAGCGRVDQDGRGHAEAAAAARRQAGPAALP